MKYPMDTFELKDEHQEINNNYLVRSIIGTLQYLAHKARPDIMSTVQFLSTKTNRPTLNLLNACKNVIRYLMGTLNYSLKLGPIDKNNILELYTDARYDVNSVEGQMIL